MSAAAVDQPSGLPQLHSRSRSASSLKCDGSPTPMLSSDAEQLLINSMKFIDESPKKSIVPNHILDTKSYSTLGNNGILTAVPTVLHFAGFEVGRVKRLKLDIVNSSASVQRMHILPPQTKHFRIQYTKSLRLVPGLSVSCSVEFEPDEWRYYYDCIRIHCKGEDNLIVPIHAFPVINTSQFPKFIDFSLVPVGETQTRVFPLRSEAPMNFDFQLTFLQSHSAFTVEPVAGIVPANGEVDISVVFCPTSFQTATAKLQLTISQYLSQPLVCTVLGQSAPGLYSHTDVPEQQPSELKTEDSLDPCSASPLARRHSRKPKSSQSSTLVKQLSHLMMRDGLVIPPQLDTPHAVSFVLTQKRGQLTMKHVQKVLQKATTDQPLIGRQVKETIFQMAIRENVNEEKRNQLCWQVKLGEDAATFEQQAKVLEDRIHDWKMYKKSRGDVDEQTACSRRVSERFVRKTRRDAGEVASLVANFDPYINDMWVSRHAVLTRFQQAARKVIIRQRMLPRLKALQQFVQSDIKHEVSVVDNENSAAHKQEFFDVSHISRITFPVYFDGHFKADLAVDALGPVSLLHTPFTVNATFPYFPLQVPQYSAVYGYSRVNVQTAASSYISQVTLQALRQHAQDDDTVQCAERPATLATQPVTGTTAHDDDDDDDADVADMDEVADSWKIDSLYHPPALLQPVKYPALHIFNSAAGLLPLVNPLPYSEIDADHHVCPLPRFTSDSHASSTQKHYLDRQDTIKGLMTWKKFPSPAVTSTTNASTLCNVWVPRRRGAFNTELLPAADVSKSLLLGDVSTSLLLGGPDVTEELCQQDNSDEAGVCLTFEMVKAEFAAIDANAVNADASKEDVATSPTNKKTATANAQAASLPAVKDVFPDGSKLPATNLPTSAAGPVQRAKMEMDLKTFISRKHNVLGEKIESRVADNDQLMKDHSLTLK